MPNLVTLAEGLPEGLWKPLNRPAKYEVRTETEAASLERQGADCQRAWVQERRLQSEQVAEFDYRPTKCRKTYRIVVLRKNLSVEQSEQRLFDEIAYFFYITNRPDPLGSGDRAPGERTMQPGEPDRAAQERRPGDAKCRWTTW